MVQVIHITHANKQMYKSIVQYTNPTYPILPHNHTAGWPEAKEP